MLGQGSASQLEALWSLWAGGALPRLNPRSGEGREGYLERCLTSLLPAPGPEGLIVEEQQPEDPYGPVREREGQDPPLQVGLRVLQGHSVDASSWYQNSQRQAPGLAPALLRRLQRALRVPSWSGFEAFDHFKDTLWQGEDSEAGMLERARLHLGEDASEEEVLGKVRDEYGAFYTLTDLRNRLGAEFCVEESAQPDDLQGDLEARCVPYAHQAELMRCILALEALSLPALLCDHAGSASGWLFLTLENADESGVASNDWILESYEEYHSYYMESGEHPDTHTLTLDSESFLELLALLRVEAQLMARVCKIMERQN